ncbi:hypothetical protein T484DRAFT_1603400, partial [Baffinella frigidus]
QVEVLFVLCTLLAGRRKAQVQEQLISLGLIPSLVVMFERLDCKKPPPASPRQVERIHGPGCECDPESALRIQFLRLVHNLADREYDHAHTKHRLLSPAELPLGFLVCSGGGTALMGFHAHTNSPLWQVFMREASDSTYRFWLASCVEAFLRGSDTRSQVFRMFNELLDDKKYTALMQVHSSSSSAPSSSSSSSSSSYECGGLISLVARQVVVANLVDSNVFIRAVVISLEFFAAREVELAALGSRYDLRACRLRRFLEFNTLRLLRDLMTVVTVEDVNQENIC